MTASETNDIEFTAFTFITICSMPGIGLLTCILFTRKKLYFKIYNTQGKSCERICIITFTSSFNVTNVASCK